MEENKPKNVHVETYADHLAGAMQDGNEGTIRKIIGQERAYEEAKRNLSPKKLANQLYLYAGIVLVAISLGVFGYVSTGKVKPEVAVEPQFTPIIFNDDTVFVNIEEDKAKTISALLSKSREGELEAFALRGVYPLEADQIIGFPRFLGVMEANLPPAEMFPFQEGFLLGVVQGETRDTFLMAEVKSFSEAFNFLRGWEKKMFYDLHDLFELPLKTSNTYLQNKDFEDGIIENKNARILWDNERKMVLAYVFADDEFIIISKSESAIREVLLRLAGSRFK